MGIIKWLTDKMEEGTTKINKEIDEVDISKRKDYKEQLDLNYKSFLCCGKVYGFDDNDIRCLDVFEDRIRFVFKETKVGDLKNGEWINRSDIKNIRLMNDIQIHEESNLGKMMVFGLLSLGMKKNTKEVNSRSIVFTVSEHSMEYSVIIKLTEYDDRYLETTKRLNRWLETGEFERVI